MTKPKSTLASAYDVVSPADNRRLYDDWAAGYDADLRDNYDYVYPREIAKLFQEQGGVGPVLDIGCGTGLIGEALRLAEMDGADISEKMLDAARAKAVYRRLFIADLMAKIPVSDATYAGFISAGVFTEGHVGPGALDELIRIAAPGALFVLGVNERVFERLGFPAAFERFAAEGLTTAPAFRDLRIYGEKARHDAADNRSVAAVFHRTAEPWSSPGRGV